MGEPGLRVCNGLRALANTATEGGAAVMDWPQGSWSDTVLTRTLGLVLTVVAVLLLIRWLVERTRVLRRQMTPVRPFLRVAEDISLDWTSRWWLMRVARHNGLRSPLTLLMSRQTMRHHVRRYADRFPADRAERIMGQLQRVERRVFGADVKVDY
jgi:hypothetical protein